MEWLTRQRWGRVTMTVNVLLTRLGDNASVVGAESLRVSLEVFLLLRLGGNSLGGGHGGEDGSEERVHLD